MELGKRALSSLVLSALLFVAIFTSVSGGVPVATSADPDPPPAAPPTVEWNRTYGGAYNDMACSVQQTSDGGYIVAGWTYSYGAGQYDFWLVKLAPEDNTPPVTSLTIGEPKIVYSGNTYVNSSTPFTLTATDNPGGSGVATTAYKIYNATHDSGWITYEGTFNIPNWLEKGGTYHIAYNSTDHLGNREQTRTTTVTVILHKVKLEIKPMLVETKPGQTATYILKVTNIGNVPDTYNLTIKFIDFNGLYQAYPTTIQTAWTLLDKTLLALNPGQWETATFRITIPANWTGVEDTTYTFNVTTICQADPTVSASAQAKLTVIPTKLSMAEYVKLEIQRLQKAVNNLNIKKGIKTSLLDKLANALMKVDQAIQLINQGRETQANNMLNAAGNMLQAFINEVQAQAGKAIPTTDAQTLIQIAQNIQQNIQNIQKT